MDLFSQVSGEKYHSVEVDGDKSSFRSRLRMMEWLDQVLASSRKLQGFSLHLKFSESRSEWDGASDDEKKLWTEVANEGIFRLVNCCKPRGSVESFNLDMEGGICGVSEDMIVFLSTSLTENYPNILSVSMGTGGGIWSFYKQLQDGVLGQMFRVPKLKLLKLAEGSMARLVLDVEKGSLELTAEDRQSREAPHGSEMLWNLLGQVWIGTDLLGIQIQTDTSKQVANYALPGFVFRTLSKSNVLNINYHMAVTMDKRIDDVELPPPIQMLPFMLQIAGVGEFFSGIQETRKKQELTVNLELSLAEWVLDGTPLRGSVEAYNNNQEFNSDFFEAELDAVDQSVFIPQINMDGMTDGELRVDNFWEGWKGGRKAVINVVIRCLDYGEKK